jgi:hypothetical protein
MAKAARRRTGSGRKRKSHARRIKARPGIAVSLLRLAVGAGVVGSEQLVRRIDAAAAAAPPRTAAQGGRPRYTPGQRLGYLAVGVAAESLGGAAKLARRILRRGEDVLAAADVLASLPVIRTGAEPARATLARGRRRVGALVARGRAETVEGRMLVTRLVEDTTASSVRDIAETAVKQVSHSPEVAALVRAQSTGLVTDTILEVRANSEQADDSLERRVRSWLHRDQPGDGKAAEPARLPDGGRTG